MKLPFRPPEGLFEAAIRLFWGLPWAPFLNLEHVEWHGGAVPRSSCQLLFAFEPIWARPPLFLSRPIRPFCWLKKKKIYIIFWLFPTKWWLKPFNFRFFSKKIICIWANFPEGLLFPGLLFPGLLFPDFCSRTFVPRTLVPRHIFVPWRTFDP